MLNWISTKLDSFSYRLELLAECKRLKSAGRILPSNLVELCLTSPTRYDDFVNLLCFFDNNRSLNLIDIGANVGQFTRDFIHFFPNSSEITCFEPICMLGKTIKANVQSEKVNVINAALGKKEDRMIIRYPKQNTALASFHPYTQEVNEFYRIDDIISEEVDVLLLDKACEHFSLGSEFILKIDTQGHEVDVIQGGLKTIHRAAALVLECSFAPEYQSLEPSFFEASRLLAEINFYPIIFQRYGKKLSYYPFERDVIFVRKDLLRRIFFKNY